MVETYGTGGSIPSESVTVRTGGTVEVGVAFEATAAIIGNYNASTGTATAGEVTTVQSSAEAETAFGEGSELAEQTSLAFQNGAATVYGAPVSETSETETLSATQSATLANVPVFDPRVNDEHAVDVTDTTEGASVDVTFVDGTPTTPSDANTAELNPATGDIEFDESSDYEVTYEYGDYEAAIQAALEFAPRSAAVCSESPDVQSTLLAELNNIDVNFEFSHGYVGEQVDLDNLQNYDNTYDDRRLVTISAARGYTDAAETNEVRTVGAVAGKQAGKPLGDTSTAEDLNGLASLKQSPSNQQAGTLIDAGVYPLQQNGGIKVVKDTNTSDDPRLNRVAWSEIVDEATAISQQISNSFVGEANIGENRLTLAESHRSAYDEMADDNLLDGYFVAVSEGDTANAVDLDIGLDVVDYMDSINVTITVGDVVLNRGVA